MTALVKARGMAEVQAVVGQQVGPTAWRVVTQEMVNTFARLSGDHQWIHVDTERAIRESPYGCTIAHGNLTLGMVDGFRDALVHLEGVALGVNYGWNRVRFPAPVKIPARLRASLVLLSMEKLESGWWQLVQRFTVEAEGESKPVCVAESVVRVVFAEDSSAA